MFLAPFLDYFPCKMRLLALAFLDFLSSYPLLPFSLEEWLAAVIFIIVLSPDLPLPILLCLFYQVKFTRQIQS